jgi:hypothetical protein
MVLIHNQNSAKYLQPSCPLLGYMSWRGNVASVFLVGPRIEYQGALQYWKYLMIGSTYLVID